MSGESYIGQAPLQTEVYSDTRVTVTAVGGETTFAVAYTVGYLDVFLNGSKQQVGIDFTATNGTSFTLTTALAAGDVLDYRCVTASTPFDYYLKSEVDVSLGAINSTLGTKLTQAQTDARYTGIAQTITATANTPANGLTIAALNSVPLIFRSASASNGAVSAPITTPSNDLVIPAGATLGATNAIEATYVVVEMNNGGIREFAISNRAGGLQCDERNLISTTAIDTSSDSASVWYSTTARTSLPYRLIGTFTCTQATAGTYVTAVSAVQSAFGEALTAMGSLGYGQTWQTVTRISGTTYYNATGKPIELSFVPPAGGNAVSVVINGFTAANYTGGATAQQAQISLTIPSRSSYVLTYTGTAINISELR